MVCPCCNVCDPVEANRLALGWQQITDYPLSGSYQPQDPWLPCCSPHSSYPGTQVALQHWILQLRRRLQSCAFPVCLPGVSQRRPFDAATD